MWETLKGWLQTELYVSNEAVVTPLSFVLAFGIVGIALIVSGMVRGLFKSRVAPRLTLHPGVLYAIGRFLHYLIILIGFAAGGPAAGDQRHQPGADVQLPGRGHRLRPAEHHLQLHFRADPAARAPRQRRRLHLRRRPGRYRPGDPHACDDHQHARQHHDHRAQFAVHRAGGDQLVARRHHDAHPRARGRRLRVGPGGGCAAACSIAPATTTRCSTAPRPSPGSWVSATPRSISSSMPGSAIRATSMSFAANSITPSTPPSAPPA